MLSTVTKRARRLLAAPSDERCPGPNAPPNASLLRASGGGTTCAPREVVRDVSSTATVRCMEEERNGSLVLRTDSGAHAKILRKLPARVEEIEKTRRAA